MLFGPTLSPRRLFTAGLCIAIGAASEWSIHQIHIPAAAKHGTALAVAAALILDHLRPREVARRRSGALAEEIGQIVGLLAITEPAGSRAAFLRRWARLLGRLADQHARVVCRGGPAATETGHCGDLRKGARLLRRVADTEDAEGALVAVPPGGTVLGESLWARLRRTTDRAARAGLLEQIAAATGPHMGAAAAQVLMVVAETERTAAAYAPHGQVAPTLGQSMPWGPVHRT